MIRVRSVLAASHGVIRPRHDGPGASAKTRAIVPSKGARQLSIQTARGYFTVNPKETKEFFSMKYNFEICKFCGSNGATPRYRIRSGNWIYWRPHCDAHYIDHVDLLEESEHVPAEEATLTREEHDYIARLLQGNSSRFDKQVELLDSHCPVKGASVLDIGAGGGLFLSLLQKKGGHVHGIEPSETRRLFAREEYDITLRSELHGSSYWQSGFNGHFDALTAWDVIEHVNFPTQFLKEAWSLLKKDGILLLDTPARDALYYRVGICSYKMTLGRIPSFLNIMYSNSEFAHKQILSSAQLTSLLKQCGFEVVSIRKIHELSFPYSHYLKRLLRSHLLARTLEPVASLFFRLFRISNKIVVVSRKSTEFQGTTGANI